MFKVSDGIYHSPTQYIAIDWDVNAQRRTGQGVCSHLDHAELWV